MERLVDVTYRGLRVARGAKLLDAAGGEQGFVELEAPLPVGTRVTLVGEGDFRVDARVVGVVEQDGGGAASPGGAKATPGMRLDWAVPKVAEAATTMELDPDVDALIDEAGTSGGMPAADEAGPSGSSAGESRSARRRRKKNQNGRP